MRAPVRQILGLVASVTAGVYLALACLAAGCLFTHTASPGGKAHHSQDSGHSPLCAWACQTASDTGLVVESPALSTGPVVRLAVSSSNQEVPSLSSALLRSRAPPSVPFILIG